MVVAEFDIVLRGKVGSLQAKYLIECRDRPSKDHRDGSGFNKSSAGVQIRNLGVAAVSTTGFAKPAKVLAKRENVLAGNCRRLHQPSPRKSVSYHIVPETEQR